MITKSPTNKNIYRKNIYFTNSARVAFSYILKTIDFSNDDTLLIPAYIGYTDREGSGVFDPIEQNNVNYTFYPISKNMYIDLDAIEKTIQIKPVKAMLLIHYFGFLHCNIVKLKELCKKNNVLLIEDCAHTIYSQYDGKVLGEFGDFSFYSLHKVLPVDTGGFFRINNPKYLSDDIHIEDLDQIEKEPLESYISYDAKSASKQIRENYTYMAQELGKINGLKVLFPSLVEGIVPMNLPVYIEKMSREEFYFQMIDNGITLIALYYRLIDTIDREAFTESYFIADNIINFPINQDISEDEIHEIIMTTKKIFKG